MSTAISKENEQFLQTLIRGGKFESREAALNEAVRLLREESLVNGERLPTESESDEQWISDLRSWAASHRSVGHFVDDSRGSVYSERGE